MKVRLTVLQQLWSLHQVLYHLLLSAGSFKNGYNRKSDRINQNSAFGSYFTWQKSKFFFKSICKMTEV